MNGRRAHCRASITKSPHKNGNTSTMRFMLHVCVSNARWVCEYECLVSATNFMRLYWLVYCTLTSVYFDLWLAKDVAICCSFFCWQKENQFPFLTRVFAQRVKWWKILGSRYLSSSNSVWKSCVFEYWLLLILLDANVISRNRKLKESFILANSTSAMQSKKTTSIMITIKSIKTGGKRITWRN